MLSAEVQWLIGPCLDGDLPVLSEKCLEQALETQAVCAGVGLGAQSEDGTPKHPLAMPVTLWRDS